MKTANTEPEGHISSRKLSRGTYRKRVKGGTSICSRCDQERALGSAYCKEHRKEYQRDWRKRFHREVIELRALRDGHGQQNQT